MARGLRRGMTMARAGQDDCIRVPLVAIESLFVGQFLRALENENVNIVRRQTEVCCGTLWQGAVRLPAGGTICVFEARTALPLPLPPSPLNPLFTHRTAVCAFSVSTPARQPPTMSAPAPVPSPPLLLKFSCAGHGVDSSVVDQWG